MALNFGEMGMYGMGNAPYEQQQMQNQQQNQQQGWGGMDWGALGKGAAEKWGANRESGEGWYPGKHISGLLGRIFPGKKKQTTQFDDSYSDVSGDTNYSDTGYSDQTGTYDNQGNLIDSPVDDSVGSEFQHQGLLNDISIGDEGQVTNYGEGGAEPSVFNTWQNDQYGTDEIEDANSGDVDYTKNQSAFNWTPPEYGNGAFSGNAGGNTFMNTYPNIFRR